MRWSALGFRGFAGFRSVQTTIKNKLVDPLNFCSVRRIYEPPFYSEDGDENVYHCM